MKFCQKCGKEIMDEAVICPNCGCQTDSQYQTSNTEIDSGSVGWAFLGFFIPVAGLILYLIWKDTKPYSAKEAGKGALIGFIINIVLSIIFGVIWGVAAFSLLGI